MNKKVKCFVLLCLAACVTIVFFACSCGGKRLTFNASFYFVCYKTQDDAHSASSVSSAVQSLGGAGYIISCEGKYYITFACYYQKEEAQSVCSSLKDSGLECTVLDIEVNGYDLSDGNAQSAEEIYGCLNTLCQTAEIMYETANSLDKGRINQQSARELVAAAVLPLRALAKSSFSSPIRADLDYILSKADELSVGFVYARDVRALQIALCDCVINAQFS